ncbi:hypothetical protein QEZ52_03005 [Aliisedimentitalea scapharcae]|uniref:Secreted protein n=1 Tax=Aliisedimentitalea scapharcae TaxID=1524259 RepID=A0ABZ2XXF8_9RHOB
MSLASSQSNRPALHRRFIAIVLAASVAVTGFTAAPARAGDDLGKILAGLAAIALIGVAVEKRRKDKAEVVTRNPVHVDPYKPKHGGPRNLPPRVARYDLPRHCVRTFPGAGETRILGLRCLKNNYSYVGSLPQACRVTVDTGHKHRTGYVARCLKKRGYRITRR